MVSCTECGSGTLSFLALTLPQTSSALGKILKTTLWPLFFFLTYYEGWHNMRVGIIQCSSIVAGGAAACCGPWPTTLCVDVSMVRGSPCGVAELDSSPPRALPSSLPQPCSLRFSPYLPCRHPCPCRAAVVPLLLPAAQLGPRQVPAMPVAPRRHLPEVPLRVSKQDLPVNAGFTLSHRSLRCLLLIVCFQE